MKMRYRDLCKAKRVDDGEWVVGYLYRLSENYHPFIMLENRYGESYEVDESTICQCTGLKDKNGNLIWENDIVGFWDAYSTENGQAEMDCIGKVVWDDETISFQVTNRLSAESYEVLDECSVIGNIFDNPELLESEG